VKGEGVETGVGDIKSHDIEHRTGEASGLGCQYVKGWSPMRSVLPSSQVIAHSRSAP
jgi:hypothetical protein